MRFLRGLPYWEAFCLVAAFNFAAYATALYLLFRRFRLPWGLFPAFAFFQPAVVVITFGQDIPLYLLTVVVALLLLLDGKDVSAGLLLAMGGYKFHLVAFVPVALLFKRRHRVLAAFALAGLFGAIASALLVSPSDFFAMLGSNEAYQAAGVRFLPANFGTS